MSSTPAAFSGETRHAPASSWQAADDHLRYALTQFCTQERFEDEFVLAALDFWGVDAIEDLPIDLRTETPEFLLTFEWYLYDYAESASDQRMIDLFAQAEGERLPALERQLLAHWRQATLAPYEVIAVQRGSGYTVRNILDDRVYPVDEPPTSEDMKTGDILLARLLPVGEIYRPSSVFRTLGPADFPRLLATIRDWYAQYQREQPGATHADFLRQQGFLFNDYVLERMALADRLAAQAAGEDAPADAEDDFEPADPALIEATRAWLEREYIAWLDRPTPALAGLTPRAAVHEPAQRQRLLNLLDEMGSIEASYALVGEPAFEVSRLRAELQLD